MPHPPVGGKPYSNAVQNVSSTACASSSPAALSFKFFNVRKKLYSSIIKIELKLLWLDLRIVRVEQSDHSIRCKNCTTPCNHRTIQNAQ